MRTKVVTRWVVPIVGAVAMLGCGGGQVAEPSSTATASPAQPEPSAEPEVGDLEAWCLSWSTPLVTEIPENPADRAAAFESFFFAAAEKTRNEAEVAPPEIAGLYDLEALDDEIEFWERHGWDPESVPPDVMEDELGPPSDPSDPDHPGNIIEQFGRDNCFLD